LIIILTYSIRETLEDVYKNFTKVDMGKLIEQHRQQNPWGETGNELQLLHDFISKNIGKNMIIEGALGSIKDYKTIKSMLQTIHHNANIEKVYLTTDDSYDRLSNPKKQTIDALSRWYGHNADDLLILQNRSNQTLQHLKTHIEKDGVEVVWVARK
jgi:hypothetical protein